jgi:dethiobiotin synthetase
MNAKKIIFVTGTDTGVGKTLLTALLLHHFRQAGIHALAMKPFCSGGLADVRLLQSLQPGELSDREMNPYFFKQPTAPFVATKKSRKNIPLDDVVDRIKRIEKKCERLIIEGSGGLLVPLGKGYTVAGLIAKLNCRVIVVARNRLGTINHTLLTVECLQSIGFPRSTLTVVLMSGRNPDLSSRDNQSTLAELLKPVTVLSIPFLGGQATHSSGMIQKSYSQIKKNAHEIGEKLMIGRDKSKS